MFFLTEIHLEVKQKKKWKQEKKHFRIATQDSVSKIYKSNLNSELVNQNSIEPVSYFFKWEVEII